jgi:hypothetical protein
VSALPALAQRYEVLSSDLRGTLEDIRSEMAGERGGTAGIHADARAPFEGLERRVAQQSELSATDLVAAVRAASDVHADALSFLSARLAVRETHRFRTRTLPLMIGGGAVVLALVVLGILRLLHLRRRWAARKRLDAF